MGDTAEVAVSQAGDTDPPPLVRRYLERNLRTRERQPERVRFTQTGEMQLSTSIST